MFRNDSTTKKKGKIVPMILALALLAGMIALNVFIPEPVLEPDMVHPFSNVNVTWEQTFYAGGWSE